LFCLNGVGVVSFVYFCFIWLVFCCYFGCFVLFYFFFVLFPQIALSKDPTNHWIIYLSELVKQRIYEELEENTFAGRPTDGEKGLDGVDPFDPGLFLFFVLVLFMVFVVFIV
jgi:hypothetical protein